MRHPPSFFRCASPLSPPCLHLPPSHIHCTTTWHDAHHWQSCRQLCRQCDRDPAVQRRAGAKHHLLESHLGTVAQSHSCAVRSEWAAQVPYLTSIMQTWLKFTGASALTGPCVLGFSITSSTSCSPRTFNRASPCDCVCVCVWARICGVSQTLSLTCYSHCLPHVSLPLSHASHLTGTGRHPHRLPTVPPPENSHLGNRCRNKRPLQGRAGHGGVWRQVLWNRCRR